MSWWRGRQSCSGLYTPAQTSLLVAKKSEMWKKNCPIWIKMNHETKRLRGESYADSSVFEGGPLLLANNKRMREEQLFSWRSLKASTGAAGLTAASEPSAFVYSFQFRWKKCLLAKLGDKVYYKEGPHLEEPRYLEKWSFVQIYTSIQSTLELIIKWNVMHPSFLLSLIEKEAVRRRKIQVLHW